MAPYVYIRNDKVVAISTIRQTSLMFPHFVRQGPRSADFEIGGVLDKLTSEAVQFIEKAAAQTSPFCLYLPLTAPHKPTQPHERFRGKTQLGEYGDFITQVDWGVGQVLAAIDRTEANGNTLIFYTSDNGSYMHRFDDRRQDHVDDCIHSRISERPPSS